MLWHLRTFVCNGAAVSKLSSNPQSHTPGKFLFNLQASAWKPFLISYKVFIPPSLCFHITRTYIYAWQTWYFQVISTTDPKGGIFCQQPSTMPQTFFWPTKLFRACHWNSSSWLNDSQWKWFPTGAIRWFSIQGPDLLRFRQHISTTEALSLAIQCFLTLRTSNTGWGLGGCVCRFNPSPETKIPQDNGEWPESKNKQKRNQAKPCGAFQNRGPSRVLNLPVVCRKTLSRSSRSSPSSKELI